MPRRRLRLTSYSSDDEQEDDQENPLQQSRHENPVIFESATPIPNLPSPSPDLPQPLPISDDDRDEFVTVSDDLSPPSPPPPVLSSDAGTGCQVGDFLLRMGLSLKREWLDSCLRGLGLESSLESLDQKAKLCFEQFLLSDMNYCGAGLLPPNVDSMHLVDLPGPFVLQVDEIVNISCPLKGRYQEAHSGVKRCLKLSMTDGIQRVFGMEYRPIKDLQVLAPAGLKVVVCNVHVRRGLLMLVPETLEVLGGKVEKLEAARQRLVGEVNKPPRGRRSRTGVVHPLATRATLSAWPQNGVTDTGDSGSSANVMQPANGSANFMQPTTGSANVLQPTNGSTDVLQPTNGSTDVLQHSNSSTNVLGQRNCGHPNGSVNEQGHGLQNTLFFRANGRGASLFPPVVTTNQETMEKFGIPMCAENTLPTPSSNLVSDIEVMHIDASPVSRTDVVPTQHPDARLDHVDFDMVDECEHPLILSGDQETPFTYLASLSAKFAAMKGKAPHIQGKIKCFLTGVKGFQYKRRSTYELQVYVDDGSLISEILIDHKVVQEGIGYSPEEVTAALSSSDTKKASDMKDTLRQFQLFLVNFEGTMLVEINETSLPIALEMNQGCPTSDAWLLIRRVKSIASQPPQHTAQDLIDISP